MPVRLQTRDSFFDPEFVMPGCLEEGTLPWLLARHDEELFPQWLFKGWKGEKPRGRSAWPAPLLMKHLMLRFAESGMSRRASERRGHTDIVWRALSDDCTAAISRLCTSTS